MPFFMTATVASAIPVLLATKDRGSAEFRLTMAGMLCFAAIARGDPDGQRADQQAHSRATCAGGVLRGVPRAEEALGSTPQGAQPPERGRVRPVVPGSPVTAWTKSPRRVAPEAFERGAQIL
jgi:hypothetical protein